MLDGEKSLEHTPDNCIVDGKSATSNKMNGIERAIPVRIDLHSSYYFKKRKQARGKASTTASPFVTSD